MFHIGDRVTVLGSNTPKNKIGIKTGSIGYISNCSNKHIEKAGNNVYILYRMHVVFSRFGYEKKSRCEEKQVIAIYPISANEKIEQSEALDAVVKQVQDGKVSKILTSKMAGFIGKKAATICVIGRATSNINLTLQENVEEAICWFECITKNEAYWEARLIDNYVNASNVLRPKQVSMDTVHFLHEMCYSSNTKQSVFNHLRKDISSYPVDKLIRTYRMIEILASKRINDTYMKRFAGHLSGLAKAGINHENILNNELIGHLILNCNNHYLYKSMVTVIEDTLEEFKKYNQFKLMVHNISSLLEGTTKIARTVEFE